MITKINKSNNLFKCFLIGGLGNQIFQSVLLSWVKANTKKNISVITSDYNFYKNAYRQLRSIQKLYLYNWPIQISDIRSDLILLERIKARINKHFFTAFEGIITDKFFQNNLNIPEDELLQKIKSCYLLKSTCIFPQLLNSESLYPYWNEIGNLCNKEIRLQKIKTKNSDFDIVIHIRRGDYLSLERYASLSSNYYNNAIEIVKSKKRLGNKPNCLIIGNDISWAKSNLRDDIKAIYQYDSELLDFHAIASRNNLIIPNSSFSMAAAMVSMTSNINTCIVCPKNYYNSKWEIKNLYNKDWISLSN